ncbi:hypothetical protein ACFQZX_11860 [Mucilaginibacter litoreus]|uniref:Tetratricopeptide repeat-containing protein n=1 Tax=Mucilaginibacter litoreus TaxID=1048221 RepID=A0ABW3ATY6_9SPHI
MLKRAAFFLILIISSFITRAQTADEVYNKYLDFNLARFGGESEKALSLGEEILPNVDKLNDKSRISFYYSIGNLYENDSQSVKAIEYYEKVAAAVPDYYVAQRALGYLYNKQADEIKQKTVTDTASLQQYQDAIKKALPHLEKAQACDPDDDTLELIKTLYTNINDKQGLDTLNTRLKILSKNCVDLLEEK